MIKQVVINTWTLLLLGTSLSAADLTLWYQKPAKSPINEALPIGNGRLGALIFGSPERERICVNEDSLWTGDENPSGDYTSMGAYQSLGNVIVNLPGNVSGDGRCTVAYGGKTVELKLGKGTTETLNGELQ